MWALKIHSTHGLAWRRREKIDDRGRHIFSPVDGICPYRQKNSNITTHTHGCGQDRRRGAEGKTIIVIINMQVPASGCYTYLKFNNLFKWATSSCAASLGGWSGGRMRVRWVKFLFCKFRTVCVPLEAQRWICSPNRDIPISDNEAWGRRYYEGEVTLKKSRNVQWCILSLPSCFFESNDFLKRYAWSRSRSLRGHWLTWGKHWKFEWWWGEVGVHWDRCWKLKIRTRIHWHTKMGWRKGVWVQQNQKMAH